MFTDRIVNEDHSQQELNYDCQSILIDGTVLPSLYEFES